MIDSDLQAEIHDLVYRIAPELKGYTSGMGGLYLLDSADLAALRPEPSGCYGYASEFLHPLEKQHLLDTEQFRGAPSGTIVFCTTEIRAAAENFDRAVLEVALHEICHLLPTTPEILRTAEFGPRMSASIEAGHHQLVTSPPGGADAVLKEDHGSRFIRIAAHVWFRAMALGIVAAAHNMFAGWKWNLSHPYDYLEALEGEPLAMLHADFTEIQKAPVSDRFETLWEADKERLTNGNAH